MNELAFHDLTASFFGALTTIRVSENEDMGLFFNLSSNKYSRDPFSLEFGGLCRLFPVFPMTVNVLPCLDKNSVFINFSAFRIQVFFQHVQPLKKYHISGFCADI